MFSVPQRPVRALVIATDPGDGFATSRWLERWGDTTLIEHVLGSTADWPVDELFVVLGADAEAIVEACDLGGAHVIIDPEWEEGAAAPLRAGLDVLTRRGEDGPAMLADAARAQPSADEVARLIAGHDPEAAPVTVTKYRYAAGPPYLVEPRLWPRLMGREGSTALDVLWKAHPEWVAEVRIDRPPPREVRTPDDLEHMRPTH